MSITSNHLEVLPFLPLLYVIIRRPQGTLLDQEWFDNYQQPVIKTFIAKAKDEAAIVRLNVLAESK